MAVSSLPTSKQIEPVLLQCLADGKVWCWKALVDALVEHFSLTKADLEESLSSGQSRFYHRCAWARLDLKVAGLVETPRREYWQITELGLQELHKFQNRCERTVEEPATPKSENIAKTQYPWANRIAINPKIVMGRPAVRGTRLTVEFILELLANGWSEAEILENYPSLVLEDIRACLAYASAMLSAAKDYPCPIGLANALLNR